MAINSVKITLEYEAETGAHVAKLQFGGVTARVDGNARYLTDDFYDGYCCLEVPNNAHRIFARHRLNRLTDASNGSLMRVLRRVFVDCDTSAFQQQVQNRQAKNAHGHAYKPIEVNVKNDRAVQDLFADDDFIEIMEHA
jgi:hypothetical protein